MVTSLNFKCPGQHISHQSNKFQPVQLSSPNKEHTAATRVTGRPAKQKKLTLLTFSKTQAHMQARALHTAARNTWSTVPSMIWLWPNQEKKDLSSKSPRQSLSAHTTSRAKLPETFQLRSIMSFANLSKTTAKLINFEPTYYTF